MSSIFSDQIEVKQDSTKLIHLLQNFLKIPTQSLLANNLLILSIYKDDGKRIQKCNLQIMEKSFYYIW